jgi:hypothetical protein
MSIRYAVMAMTGVNDPSKMLKRAEKHPVFWDAFADAKADVVARADALREYLVSSGRDFEMHVDSGDHHYMVWFAYGPASPEPTLPFKMVLHVSKCKVTRGQVQQLEL